MPPFHFRAKLDKIQLLTFRIGIPANSGQFIIGNFFVADNGIFIYDPVSISRHGHNSLQMNPAVPYGNPGDKIAVLFIAG